MIATIVAAVLLIGAAQQSAPRDAAPPAAKPPGTGVISGTVVAADTRTPIRRAIVSVSGGSDEQRVSRTVYTDARGRYEATGLPAGAYVVIASPNLYQRQFLGSLPPAGAQTIPRLTLADGESIRDHNLELPRAGAIVGRLVDEAGDPVSTVHVSAMRPADPADRGLAHGQVSDEFGRFRLFGLAPGEYQIVARPMGGDYVPDGRSLGFVQTYYPGTFSRNDAARVRVSAGQEAAAGDFQLTRARMLRINGRVLDSHGRTPPSSTQVSFAGTAVNEGTSLREAGRFQFGPHPPGTYRVSAQVRDESYENVVEYGALSVTLDQDDIDDLLIATRPTVAIAGRLVFESAPAPSRIPEGTAVNTVTKGLTASSDLRVRPASVGADLAFTLRGLAGERLVRPTGPLMATWTLKSVLLGSEDITDVPREFGPDDSGRLQVVLTTGGSALTGLVSDDAGKPIGGRTVVLFSEDRTKWFRTSQRFREALCGKDGRYAFKGLRSGRYYVTALPRERWPELFGSADLPSLEPFLREATPVFLGEDEQRVVDLQLARGGGGE